MAETDSTIGMTSTESIKLVKFVYTFDDISDISEGRDEDEEAKNTKMDEMKHNNDIVTFYESFDNLYIIKDNNEIIRRD